jgi:hypothetical protein
MEKPPAPEPKPNSRASDDRDSEPTDPATVGLFTPPSLVLPNREISSSVEPAQRIPLYLRTCRLLI